MRIILCIGVLIMRQNNIRRISAFRRVDQYNEVRNSPWEHLNPAPRAVPSGANRHQTSAIVNKLTLGDESEFRRMFRQFLLRSSQRCPHGSRVVDQITELKMCQWKLI